MLTLIDFITTPIGMILLAAIIADFLPSPTDPFHFIIQNYLYKHKFKRWKFELIQIFDWYVLDTLWWIFLFLIAWIMTINNNQMITIITTVATILGIGVLIGVIFRFIVHKKLR